jgi:hypothetical protein
MIRSNFKHKIRPLSLGVLDSEGFYLHGNLFYTSLQNNDLSFSVMNSKESKSDSHNFPVEDGDYEN